jgi:nucleoside-triphosphatase
MTTEDPNIRAFLLTGRPGIGKTTVMRAAAERLSGKRLFGFLTDEIRERGRRVGFRIEPLCGEGSVLAHVRSSSPYRVGKYGVEVAALEQVIDRALEAPRVGEGVVLVDEIGKMECLSERFVGAMRNVLDRGIPIVATVAMRGGGFIAEVKQRPDVVVEELTIQNRDTMANHILAWLGER